jgi:N-dimethylarginine dimethylaminohydrolase
MTVQQFQPRYSGLGGEGWVPRLSSLRDEQGMVWTAFGAFSECGRLRSVLMRRPGSEIEMVEDPRQALWMGRPDPAKAREQHDALAELYRAHGVCVHYIEGDTHQPPNLYFVRDTFAMTPEGAIIARPAARVRAGEERIVAHALAQLGIPIVLSIHGCGTFEGADLMIINEDLAFVSQGLRTNAAGADQVERLLAGIGIAEVVRVELDADCMHLDCALGIVTRDVALLTPGKVSAALAETLHHHGFRIITAPQSEVESGMAVNTVAIEPGLVILPAGNPVTRAALEQAGVECHEADVSELMKGGGAVHCMTGVLHREGV